MKPCRKSYAEFKPSSVWGSNELLFLQVSLISFIDKFRRKRSFSRYFFLKPDITILFVHYIETGKSILVFASSILQPTPHTLDITTNYSAKAFNSRRNHTIPFRRKFKNIYSHYSAIRLLQLPLNSLDHDPITAIPKRRDTSNPRRLRSNAMQVPFSNCEFLLVLYIPTSENVGLS